MRALKTIKRDRLVEVLDYDLETGLFRWKLRRGKMPAGSVAGTTRPDGYLIIRIDWVTHYGHRLAWLYMTGQDPPPGIDHANGEASDNRWANLRAADQSLNTANARLAVNNLTGFKGVSWDKRVQRWRASICQAQKQIWLGYFDTPEAAHKAYTEAANRLFGEFARAA
jgi:hypothetical protein